MNRLPSSKCAGEHWLLALLAAAGGVFLVGSCSTKTSGAAFPDASVGPDGGVEGPATAGEGGASAISTAWLQASTDRIDFGSLDCGAAADSSFAVRLRNRSSRSIAWRATLSDAPAFALQGDGAGSLAAGASVDLLLTAHAVEADAVAGTVRSATFVVSSDDELRPTFSLPVRATVRGATLGIDRPSYDFGDRPLGGSTTLPFKITNSGSAPVRLNLSAPSDDQIVVEWANSPNAATLEGGASLDGALTLRPMRTGLIATSAPIQAFGTFCGAVPKTLAITASVVRSGAIVSPGSLNFGSVPCGKQGVPQSFSIANDSASPMTFATSLVRTDGVFALSPATGTIAPRGKADVTVTPGPMTHNSSVAANAYGDTAIITTDAAGDGPHTVDLFESAYGVRLVTTSPALSYLPRPPGYVRHKYPPLTNAGNAPAHISIASDLGDVFHISDSGWNTLDPGATWSDHIIYVTADFTPQRVGDFSATFSVTAANDDPLCAPLPTFTAHGVSVSEPIAASAATVDFGAMKCGATASPSTLSFTNWGFDAKWTAAFALGAASPYAVSPTSGSIAGDAKTNLTISPKAIGSHADTSAGALNDTLIFSTVDAYGTVFTHRVPVTGSALGVALQVSTSALAIAPPSTSGVVRLTNAGSADAHVTLAIAESDVVKAFAASPLGATTVPAGGGVDVTVVFDPAARGDAAASLTISLSPSDAPCDATPVSVGLSGTVP